MWIINIFIQINYNNKSEKYSILKKSGVNFKFQVNIIIPKNNEYRLDACYVSQLSRVAQEHIIKFLFSVLFLNLNYE